VNERTSPKGNAGTEWVYRTTDAVKCEWCGAEPGQRCHLQDGQIAGTLRNPRYHTIRVDPTSDPIGYLDPAFGSAFRRVVPL